VAAHPTRRRVLAATAMLPLAALSGCDGAHVLAAPPSPARDVRLLRAAIAAEQLLVDRYTAVLKAARAPGGAAAGGGSLTAVLEPLLAQHRAHLDQLRSRLVVPAGSPEAAQSPSRRAATPAVPASPGAAVVFLRTAEREAAAAMLDRLPGVPSSLAQLFASISASEATHVPVLDAAAAAQARG
jgi:hypothetical protein